MPREIDYKLMPNGDIRAYQRGTPDKRGVSERQYTSPLNAAPTVTSAHCPKVFVPCAIRTRRYAGKGERLECNPGPVANAITSVSKDSMLLVAKIVGFTRARDGKGAVTKHHLKDVANTITSFSASGFTTSQYVMEARVKQVGQLLTGSAWANPQVGRVYDPTGISPSIDTCQGGGREPKVIIPSTPPMETQDYILRFVIRKLTARECFRLQGVLDEDIDKIEAYRRERSLKGGRIKLEPISESQQYKMAGNSIAVDVLRHLFRNLLPILFPGEAEAPQPAQADDGKCQSTYDPFSLFSDIDY